MLDTAGLARLGIDTEEGLAYCADDQEFYEEMLGEFSSEGRAASIELNGLFSGRDWAAYAIRVHAVKSMSRMIGAKGLSEHARELEVAAKEGDEALILDRHAPFISALDALIEGIREAIA